MSDSDFDIDSLFNDDVFNQFIDTTPILTTHTTVWGSGMMYNTPKDHPDRLKHVDMNIKFDDSHPTMREEYEKESTTQMVILPVKQEHCTKRLIDYSHDIFYMIYNKTPTSEIDAFIRTINSDTVYCCNHPPFRFRYLNVLVTIINNTSSSSYLYC